MDISNIKKLNSNFLFCTTKDELFKRLGSELDVSSNEIISYVNKNIPVYGSSLHIVQNYPELLNFNCIDEIKQKYFDNKQIQFGIVAGLNESLNNLLYLSGNKICVAFSDSILFLGHKTDVINDRLSNDKMIGLCLEKGQVVQLYKDTLYSIPVNANLYGFSLGFISEDENGMRLKESVKNDTINVNASIVDITFFDSSSELKKSERIRCVNR